MSLDGEKQELEHGTCRPRKPTYGRSGGLNNLWEIALSYYCLDQAWQQTPSPPSLLTGF